MPICGEGSESWAFYQSYKVSILTSNKISLKSSTNVKKFFEYPYLWGICGASGGVLTGDCSEVAIRHRLALS